LSEGRRLALAVQDEVVKQRILAALADETSRRILADATQNQMSLLVMSKRYQVPAEKIDQRLTELLEIGLLAVVKTAGTSNGLAYRSLVDQVNMRLSPEGVSVHLGVNGTVSSREMRGLLQVSRPEDERMLAEV
jgi:hypothetical protein